MLVICKCSINETNQTKWDICANEWSWTEKIMSGLTEYMVVRDAQDEWSLS